MIRLYICTFVIILRVDLERVDLERLNQGNGSLLPRPLPLEGEERKGSGNEAKGKAMGKAMGTGS